MRFSYYFKRSERLEKESEKAYSYFCCYRDLGVERTLKSVHEKYQINTSNIEHYSAKHNWVERSRVL